MKISDLKAGMTDAATMLKDRNLNPFLRPLLVLLVVIVVAWFLHQGTSAQISDMRRKSEAQAAEVENREEYLKLKAKYVKLIEELPPNTQKSFDLWFRDMNGDILDMTPTTTRVIIELLLTY